MIRYVDKHGKPTTGISPLKDEKRKPVAKPKGKARKGKSKK